MLWKLPSPRDGIFNLEKHLLYPRGQKHFWRLGWMEVILKNADALYMANILDMMIHDWSRYYFINVDTKL